jgi:hypothetical protein
MVADVPRRIGIKLLQREVLEAKAGGASTVQVETRGTRRSTLTARSEPYNGTVLHASRLKQNANAR